MIYFHPATLTTAGGTNNTLTLRIPHGICQQVLIRALTSSATVFSADITNSDSALRVLDFGYHEGEINELDVGLPMAGVYTLNINNASVAETFRVLVGVEE